jgi:hypothetical protein
VLYTFVRTLQNILTAGLFHSVFRLEGRPTAIQPTVVTYWMCDDSYKKSSISKNVNRTLIFVFLLWGKIQLWNDDRKSEKGAKKIFHCWATTGKHLFNATKTSSRINSTRFTALNLPYVYDHVTKLCRQQAEVIQNHENEHVCRIEQDEARHRRHMRFKLGGGQAYDRSSDQDAVVA